MPAQHATHALRLGTRGSRLARAQSALVAAELQKRSPGLRVELIVIGTTGDAVQDKPLHDIGGKGLFTKELEQALLANSIDFAVHSLKDVPVTMPLVDVSTLVIAAAPVREDPRDVLVSPIARSLGDLPAGARVGTGSLRRRCQILALRPDLLVQPLRGNVDTRLNKLKSGQYDAIVLAMAGVRRCGLFDDAMMAPIDPAHMLPAAGQGALALQCRGNDANTRNLLELLNDADTLACVNCERAVVTALGGDCHSPIAALAIVRPPRDRQPAQLFLRAAVGAYGGATPIVSASAAAPLSNASEAIENVVKDLQSLGAAELLTPRPSDP